MSARGITGYGTTSQAAAEELEHVERLTADRQQRIAQQLEQGAMIAAALAFATLRVNGRSAAVAGKQALAVGAEFERAWKKAKGGG